VARKGAALVGKGKDALAEGYAEFVSQVLHVSQEAAQRYVREMQERAAQYPDGPPPDWVDSEAAHLLRLEG